MLRPSSGDTAAVLRIQTKDARILTITARADESHMWQPCWSPLPVLELIYRKHAALDEVR